MRINASRELHVILVNAVNCQLSTNNVTVIFTKQKFDFARKVHCNVAKRSFCGNSI